MEMMKQVKMRAISVRTLMRLSQNSTSPKIRTRRTYEQYISTLQTGSWPSLGVKGEGSLSHASLTLIAIMTSPNTVIQMATFKSGLQKLMMSPAAVRLVGILITYLRK